MSVLYRVMGGAVLFCGITVYGTQADKKVIEKYNLSEPEQSFMQSCKNTMSRHNLSFAHGANTAKGCACMTKVLSSSVEGNELPAVKAYIGITMRTRASTTGNNMEDVDFVALQKNIEEVNEKHNVSDLKAMEYISLVGNSVMSCGDRKNHSPEKIAEYAAMVPKGSEVKLAQVSGPTTAKPKPSIQPKTTPQSDRPKLRGLSDG